MSRWREISEFPGYEINTFGQVRSYWGSGPGKSRPGLRHHPITTHTIGGVPVVTLETRGPGGRRTTRTVASVLRATFPEPTEAPAC